MTDEHKTTVSTFRQPDRSPRFVVSCSCGWSSEPVSTAGTAAALSAHHADPDRHPVDLRRPASVPIADTKSPVVSHEFAGSGVDAQQRTYWQCSCGWQTDTCDTVKAAADALAAHFAEVTAETQSVDP